MIACRARLFILWFWGIPSLLLLGALLGCPPASAQSAPPDSAQAYFHRAAQHYLADDADTALQVIAEGLRMAPNNAKLQALRTEIERQPPQSDPAETGVEGAGSGEGEGTGAGDPGGTSAGSDAPQDAESDAEAEPGAAPNPSGQGAPSPQQGEPAQDDASEAGTAPQEAPSAGREPGQAGAGGTASKPEGPHGDPTPRATAPEQGPSPPDVQNAPAEPPPGSGSLQSVPTLTPEQVEQLLQLVDAQREPRMPAIRVFGRAAAAGPDW